MPRLAPVTNATLPCRLITTSLNSGQGRACGGEGVWGVQIIRIDSLDAALVQPRQDTARTALDQIGHASLSHADDRLDPAHRAVQLRQQISLESIEIGNHARADILHQREDRKSTRL